MKTIEIQEASRLVQEGMQITHGERMRLVEQRLHALVDYARENSPYLSEYYKDLPADYSLSDIPVMEKGEMIANYDDYVTDRQICLKDVESYVRRDFADASLFLNKYTVLHTSGTTGTPLYMVRDEHRNRIHNMMMAQRLLNDVDPELGDLKKHKQAAVIHAEPGASSYEAYRRTVAQNGSDNLLFIPVTEEVGTMIEKLNEFQPEVLSAYASILVILALAAEKGQLNISLKMIATSAEMLTPENYQFVKRVFNCPIKNNYCMTEGGEIAMTWDGPELLYNEDFIIIEPVDENRMPVKDPDDFSQGILVTDLTNYVQPIIRYYVNDRVKIERISDDAVRLPVLQIKGRVNDIFQLCGNTYTTVSLATIVEYYPGVLDYQFVQVADDELCLRALTAGVDDRAKALAEMADELEKHFRSHGSPLAKVSWTDEYPIRKERGGKAPRYMDLRS